MSFSDEVLRGDERAIYRLRELYSKHGYSRFKVSRFEEYDLYARNKSFLVNENVLTFTDTNGRLMALKPDVTLSIVKNIPSDSRETNKLYYNENVYRPSAEGNGFKEIVQTGLECIGHVDMFAQSEVIMLALRSLEAISGEYILDVSHMGLLEGLLDKAGVREEDRGVVTELIKSKNVSGLRRTLEALRADISAADAVLELAQLYLPLDGTLAMLEKCCVGSDKAMRACGELKSICNIMKLYGLSERLYFDFSIVNDRSYYDGVIFKGFINGIPDSVLSGGRYDRLLERMGKSSSAIGFALYLDRLERFGAEERRYDADVLLAYDTDVDCETVIAAVKRLNDSGKTVRTCSSEDKSSARCRESIKIGKKGAERLETDD